MKLNFGLILRFQILIIFVLIYGWSLALLESNYSSERIAFELSQNSSTTYIIAIATLVLSSYILVNNPKSSQEQLKWLMVSCLICPGISLYLFNPFYFQNKSAIIANLQILLGIFVFHFVTRRSNLQNLKSVDVSFIKNITLTKIAYFLTITSILLNIIYYGSSLQDFSLSTIYIRRQEFGCSDECSFMRGYFWIWISRIFITFGVLIGFAQKRKTLLFLNGFLMLIMFSADGSKSTLLLWILAVGLFFILQRDLISDTPLLGIATIAFLMIPNLISQFSESKIFTFLIPRRVGLTPAQLSVDYIQYYNEFGATNFAHSLFRRFLSEESRINIPAYVGRVVWKDGDTSWYNTNSFIDAYVGMGALGVILISMLMGVTILLLNGLIPIQDKQVWTALCTAICFSWINSSFFTSLLTHGILIVIILAFLTKLHLVTGQKKFM